MKIQILDLDVTALVDTGAVHSFLWMDRPVTGIGQPLAKVQEFLGQYFARSMKSRIEIGHKSKEGEIYITMGEAPEKEFTMLIGMNFLQQMQLSIL